MKLIDLMTLIAERNSVALQYVEAQRDPEATEEELQELAQQLDDLDNTILY